MTIDWPIIFWVLLALVILLVVLLLRGNLIFRPTRSTLKGQEVDRVNIMDEIRDLINRSIELRSLYEIKVRDPDYREIYKGQALGINWDDELEIEIGPYTGANLDFHQKKIHVTFRMTDRGRHEQYEFDSVSKFIEFTDDYGPRVKALRVKLPTSISAGQKRRHPRLAPEGPYSFYVVFFERGAQMFPPWPLKSFRRLYSAQINDISEGGMQVVFPGKPLQVELKAGDVTYLYFRLPLTGLDVQDIPEEFFIQAKIVKITQQPTGRRVLTQMADDVVMGPPSVRLQFIGRGLVERKSKTVVFHPASAKVFGDLGRWLEAYQMRQFQKKPTRRSIFGRK